MIKPHEILIAMAVAVLLSIILIRGSEAKSETDHTLEWCPTDQVDYRLSDGTRVDCLTEHFAIEVDWAIKWYEAIGQSLHYAIQTGRYPGILLLVEESGDCLYVDRLLLVLHETDLPIQLWTTPIRCQP